MVKKPLVPKVEPKKEIETVKATAFPEKKIETMSEKLKKIEEAKKTETP